MVSNQAKGGFSKTEDLLVNTHAGSLRWQKFWLHNMDISDPHHEGQSFIEVPTPVWNEFSIRSLNSHYGNQNGYQWKIVPDARGDHRDNLTTSLSVASHLGGPTFMPARTFDREPVQDWGAPEFRKHFSPSYEWNLGYSFSGLASRPALLFLEFISHNRNFINSPDTENNFRLSSFFVQEFSREDALFLIYQGRLNEYEGIEDRQSLENTLETQRHHFILGYDSNNSPRKHAWEYHIGLGFGFENAPSKDNDFYTDLKYEVINPAPLRLPGEAATFFIDSRIERNDLPWLREFSNARLHIRSPIRFEFLQQSRPLESFKTVRTLETIPLDVFIYDRDVESFDSLLRIRPSLISEWQVSRLEIVLDVSLLSEQIINSSGKNLFRASPASSLRLGYDMKPNGLRLFFGLGHEPIPMGLFESQFLNSDSVSGARFRWTDQNQDGLFQGDEQGGILERRGSRYNSKDKNLKHPSLEEAYLGADYRFLKRYKAVINISAKWIRNLYWVSYAEDFDPGYVRVSRQDAHSGFLYDRVPGSYGQERYSLTNRDKSSTYLALEIQLLKEAISSWWFMNITLGGYLHLAYNLAGNGVRQNDIGFYSQESADPNQNLILAGRSHYDRGYMANFIFGFYLARGLSLTNTIRYRDGVPFGEYIFAYGLSQGPIAVMNGERANFLEGLGRYTFYLNWDIRIRYEFREFEIFLDIYNLLDSRTETLEDPFEGETFRDPLDSTIPRSFRLTVSYRFI